MDDDGVSPVDKFWSWNVDMNRTRSPTSILRNHNGRTPSPRPISPGKSVRISLHTQQTRRRTNKGVSFTKLLRVIPADLRRTLHSDKQSVPFCLTLWSVEQVPVLRLPEGKDVGESGAQLQYQLRVSLYDIMYHTFFGRTWVGSARAAKVDKAKQKYKLQYQQPIYFHTSLKDPNIVAVIEVVGVLDPGGGQPRRQMSCGWSLLRLFQKSQKLKDTSEGAPDVRKLDVYHGSPRALMLMDDTIETNENIQLVRGCQIVFSLCTHQALEKILHLVPENVLVGGGDVIPGIQEQRSKGKENADSLMKPKLLKTLQSHLDNISITPEPSLVKFEEDLCKKANDDRLERDNIGPSDGSTVNVVERRLQIGIHNGWGYVQKPQVVILAPEAETQGRARSGSIGKGHRRTPSFGSKSSLGNSSCLVARSQVQLGDLAQDASFAVVFQVEYTLSVPFALSGTKLSGSMSRVQTITVPVLWVSWSPFTSSGRPDVAVAMRGRAAPNPDNVMMFCQKSGSEDQSVGSLKFTFRRDDEPPKSLEAQDQMQLQIPSQPYAASVHSETSDGSFMQERPTMVSSRPPLPSSAKGSPRTEHRLPAYSTPLPGSLPPPLSYPTISLPYPQSHTTPPHMLSDTAMETTDMQPDTARTEDMTELTELPYTPVHAPIMLSARGTQSGQGLSRAAYARLYTAGFPPIVDRHGQSPEVVDPVDHVTVNLKQEEADPLQSNEIIFQFLAFSRMLSAQPSGSATSLPSTVFFTLQFYRFPPLITERLLLGTADKQLTSDPGSMPCILYRINKDGTVVQTPPGCQTKYHMDPSFLKPGEARLFNQYLSVQTLHIDVWDGDSLLLIGSGAMELKHLCRQGRAAVQVTHELDIITTEYSEDTPTLTGDLTRGGSVRPVGVSTILKGRLHLRMANVGHPQDRARGDGAVTVPKPPSRVVLPASAHMSSAMNTGQASPLLNQKTSRAKRLAETDNELALVLTARKDPNITQLASLDTGGELDSARKRKLARMQAVRQTQGCEKDLNTVNTVLLQKEEKAQRNRDLRTVELYREQTKHDGITSMLSQVITTHYTVFPSLGTAEFFEFVLKNPYNVEHTITVDSDTPQLSIITDVREWRQFKQAHDLNTPLEESMFGTTSTSGLPAIFLRPRESVYVPFKYQSLQADHTVQPQGPSDTMSANLTTQLTTGFRPSVHHSRNIKVYFRAEDHRPVSILTVNVIAQPHVVDQTFRFYHPEQSFLKKAIRLPPYHQLQGAVVTAGGFTSVTANCSDPNVICETRKVKAGEPQDVFLKVACGPSPSVKKFFVIIYTDPHQSKPCQIWQFYLHALQRVDISCVEGQTSRFSLILRGTNASRLVRVFPSHPTEIKVSPDTPFMLAANAVHEVNVGVRPLSLGSKFLYINVVDTEYHQLIRTWLICMQTTQAVISKAFDLQLPIGGGKGCNKRIPYTNPYMHRKTFVLRTNRQDLLQFKENTFELGSGDVYTIGMRFAPSQQQGTTEILIFINDEDDKNEETFCIKANYS
ncbi:nephrocystin-4-like isoform X4 [Branchiostoma lanceolatum]|uniref:nephrocystin-4-like isoform X4 n=1 Tax=Branchiostoma lanceolatum TaxID=7740 RepID=UPI003452E335